MFAVLYIPVECQDWSSQCLVFLVNSFDEVENSGERRALRWPTGTVEDPNLSRNGRGRVVRRARVVLKQKTKWLLTDGPSLYAAATFCVRLKLKMDSSEDTALPCHYKDDLSTIAVDREISEFTASGFAEERTDRTDGRRKWMEGKLFTTSCSRLTLSSTLW